MPESPLRLIKRCAEYIEVKDVNKVPKGLRGIYVLYYYRPRLDKYDVVYVGITLTGKGGIRGRVRGHRKWKEGLWTHCSIFEVWDNVRDDEIIELEGLFRHIYKRDSRANKLNVQRGFRKMRMVRDKKFWEWKN
ncbi:GIY-YIG nuclease family protein [Thermodesulfobacteriota bacterium]